MNIYISSAGEDLPVARQLADLLAHNPYQAGAGAVNVYPFADPAQPGENWAAKAERQLAESQFIVLLLSPAALVSPWVARDVDQVRRLRDASALKHIVAVALRPLPPGHAFEDAIAGLTILDTASESLNAVAAELAYLATWRPRQTGGSISFAPPPGMPAQSPAGPDAPPAEPAPSAPPQEWGAPPAAPPAPAGPPPAPAGPPPPPVPVPQPAPVSGSRSPWPMDLPIEEDLEEERAAPPMTKSATRDARTLQFSAYHPNTVAVESWQTLLVYTYLAEALAQIEADAGTFTELGSAPTVASGQSARTVASGVELTIEPHMDGVTFSPRSDTFIWRGDWRRSLFRFSGAALLAGQTRTGWIDVYAAPMVPVARIDLTIPFHDTALRQLAAEPPRGMIVTSNIYDAVFISYSHRDTEAFQQACEAYARFGVTVYTDQLLPAGANYERELSRMIAAASIFHLLWSPHSAASGECRKEWLAALGREPSERFIKPWYWRQPLGTLPAEFVQHRISFRYEPLRRHWLRPWTWFRA